MNNNSVVDHSIPIPSESTPTKTFSSTTTKMTDHIQDELSVAIDVDKDVPEEYKHSSIAQDLCKRFETINLDLYRFPESIGREGSSRILGATNELNTALRILLFMDLLIALSLLLLPRRRDNDVFAESSPYNPNKNVGTSYTGILFSIGPTLLSLLLTLTNLSSNYFQKMITMLLLRSIAIIGLALIFISTPTYFILSTISAVSNFVILVVISRSISLGSGAFASIIVPTALAQARSQDSSIDTLTSNALNTRAKAITKWQSLMVLRSVYINDIHRGRSIIRIFALLMLLVASALFFQEYTSILSRERSILAGRFEELNDISKVQEYFPTTLPTGNSTNPDENPAVYLIVCDGLGEIAAKRSQAWQDLLEDLSADSWQANFTVAMPTMSVPNWVTLLTGATPSLTGILGNLAIPEVEFDSVFRKAKEYNLFSGISGSLWFSDIVKSQLPRLGGDGAVDPSEGSNGEPTSAPADEIRANTTLLAQSRGEYKLFLTHFSDIDKQGHTFGIEPQWNTQDTYFKAVEVVVAHIRKIIAADTNGIYLITGDHGHVGRGGHGSVSEELTVVPGILYKEGSGLRDLDLAESQTERVASSDTFRWNDSSRLNLNVDVAPTICALMGIPSPRASLGYPLPAALTLLNHQPATQAAIINDTFERQKKFLAVYHNAASIVGTSLPEFSDLTGQPETDSQVVLEFYDYYTNVTAQFTGVFILRNFVMSFIIYLLASYLFNTLSSAFTYASPMTPTSSKRIEERVRKFREGLSQVQSWNQSWESSSVQVVVPETEPYIKFYGHSLSGNRSARSIAWKTVLAHFLISYLCYIVCYTVYGYDISVLTTSTVMHTPGVLKYYLTFTLGPAILSALFLSRFRGYTDPQLGGTTTLDTKSPKSLWKLRLLNVNARLSGTQLNHNDDSREYLMDYYMLRYSLKWLLLLFILQAPFGTIVPGFFRVPFVGDIGWSYRFLFITVLAQSLPLAWICFVEYFRGDHLNRLSSAYDDIFQLKIIKDLAKIAQVALDFDNSQNEDQKKRQIAESAVKLMESFAALEATQAAAILPYTQAADFFTTRTELLEKTRRRFPYAYRSHVQGLTERLQESSEARQEHNSGEAKKHI